MTAQVISKSKKGISRNDVKYTWVKMSMNETTFQQVAIRCQHVKVNMSNRFHLPQDIFKHAWSSNQEWFNKQNNKCISYIYAEKDYPRTTDNRSFILRYFKVTLIFNFKLISIKEIFFKVLQNIFRLTYSILPKHRTTIKIF